MRILFLEAVQNFGGARKSTIELATRLQKANYEIIIVDMWGSCKPFLEAVKEKNLQLEVLDKRTEPVILKNRNILRMLINYMIYFKLLIEYRQKLNKLLASYKPDFIIVNNTKTLSLLRRSQNYKIVYFARGWFLPNKINLLNKFLLRKLTNIFIGVSQSTRQAIFAGGFASLQNIYTVPNAIDSLMTEALLNSKLAIISWQSDKSDRPFVIMHCGGFLPSKGQHIMIEIAIKLKANKINFKIKLVGLIYKGQESEIYYNKILNLIKSNSLEDYFEIILNETDVFKYFVQMDVLVHPSSTEGLPRVALEAMALGKPVVGNAVGGMTDFISHGFTGYLTNYNSVSDYVEYCTLLEKDKLLYSFISKNAKELIKYSYTEKNQLNELSKVFN